MTTTNMKKWPQVVGALSVSLSFLSIGTLVGFATIALPQLQKDVHIQMDEDLGSWFVSLFYIVGIPFQFIGGWLGGLLGRRKLVIVSIPVLLTGFVVLGCAKHWATIFAGRIINFIRFLDYTKIDQG